jgi:hypothetical protein
MTRRQAFAQGLTALLAALVLLAPGPVRGQADQTGRWDTLATLPFFPVHDHLLPNGKVMIWPGDGGISGDDPRLWDPDTQSVTLLAKPGYDLFCAGHAFVSSGRLFAAGGHIQNGVGLSRASFYDPFANTWAAAPNMNAGRWYPTVTTLANGDVLVVSGSIDNTVGTNTLPQVYQAATGTWRNLSSAVLGQDLYPMMFLAPNGRVVNVGPTRSTRYLDTAGAGAWSTVIATSSVHRSYGSAVMYEPGKILLLGGGDPPTNSAEVIDLNQTTPAWRPTAAMSVARRQVNATLLPDGTVLVTGGTSGAGFNNPNTPVHSAELWDPAGNAGAGTWTTLASSDAAFKRLYHSAAVLLPDGRVLSTGGNGYLTPEAFSPPYLFKGARPTLSGVPTLVGYGQRFPVQTTNPAGIRKVTLIRITSVTHAFNMNQRLNVLTFTPTATGLDIVAPPNGNVAPPGHYLLFVVDGNGVPSVGSIVRLAGSAPPPPPPPPQTFTLAVTRTGSDPSKGTVTSSPAGINCGTTCSSSFATGTVVTLTARTVANRVFAGWGGACSGTAPTCTVKMDAGKAVTASFNRR